MKVCRLSSRQQGKPTGKWLGGRWEVGGDTTLRDRSNRGQGKLSGDFTELCNFSLLHPSHSTLSRSESTPGGDDRRHLCYPSRARLGVLFLYLSYSDPGSPTDLRSVPSTCKIPPSPNVLPISPISHCLPLSSLPTNQPLFRFVTPAAHLSRPRLSPAQFIPHIQPAPPRLGPASIPFRSK